jgi:disulfide bond formation protein DsbB
MSISTVTDNEVSRTSTSSHTAPMSAVSLPLLVALVALAGSLWLSVGMGLKACALCFYQRTFVMGVVAVLGIGLLTGVRHRVVLNLLAMPLAVAGVGVAAFHVFLELTGKLECPSGVLGIGTAP